MNYLRIFLAKKFWTYVPKMTFVSGFYLSLIDFTRVRIISGECLYTIPVAPLLVAKSFFLF